MDREKVVKGLESHGAGKSLWIICANCPYSNNGEMPKQTEECTHKLMEDALELLKEQETENSKISKAYLELVGKASKQPQIVRCKDCRFYVNPSYGYTLGDCSFGRVWYRTKEDGYCHRAERRTE